MSLDQGTLQQTAGTSVLQAMTPGRTSLSEGSAKGPSTSGANSKADVCTRTGLLDSATMLSQLGDTVPNRDLLPHPQRFLPAQERQVAPLQIGQNICRPTDFTDSAQKHLQDVKDDLFWQIVHEIQDFPHRTMEPMGSFYEAIYQLTETLPAVGVDSFVFTRRHVPDHPAMHHLVFRRRPKRATA